jgi:hypothetical protein
MHTISSLLKFSKQSMTDCDAKRRLRPETERSSILLSPGQDVMSDRGERREDKMLFLGAYDHVFLSQHTETVRIPSP